MENIELVIKIPKKWLNDMKREEFIHVDELCEVILHGTPLPKGHSFIAICDSDFPITEEVRQELKNTTFVGNEDCPYCFDMTEIIEADIAESEKSHGIDKNS